MTNVVPYVSFHCMRQNKNFCIPRESIRHTESFEYTKSGSPTKKVDDNRTYVRFINPDGPNKKMLHAVVDMPIEVFRATVITPAWIGVKTPGTVKSLAGTAQ